MSTANDEPTTVKQSPDVPVRTSKDNVSDDCSEHAQGEIIVSVNWSWHLSES